MSITCRRDLEELARAAVDAQLAAKQSGEPVVLGELRARLLEGLAIVMVDLKNLIAWYRWAVVARAKELGVPEELHEEKLWRYPMDGGFAEGLEEQMVTGGLSILDDDLLLEFAVREVMVHSVGQLLEGFIQDERHRVGAFWDEAMAFVSRAEIGRSDFRVP